MVSYHYGAENFTELKALYRVALKTVAVMSVFTFVIAFPPARPIARLFAEGSETVVDMAVRGTFIFAAAFLLHAGISHHPADHPAQALRR